MQASSPGHHGGGAAHDPAIAGMGPAEVKRLMDDLNDSVQEKDDLRQKLHEMENHINVLQNEKANMSAELEQLQTQVRGVQDCRCTCV